MNKKYPKTPHLPWSNGIESDDLVLCNLSTFENKSIVISEKFDGEHITISKEECYLQYRPISPKYDSNLLIEVKDIQNKLPYNYILQGEYLLFKHGIHYHNLRSYLVIYFVEHEGRILDWTATNKLLSELGLCCIEALYQGEFDLKQLKKFSVDCDTNLTMEGFVVRSTQEFCVGEFSNNVAKYVRKGYKQVRLKEVSDLEHNYLIE